MNIRDKILIVEDERSITNFLRTILVSNDYDVIVASSGAEAYSMITSHCPDLIVLDLGLPDIDGLQIIKSVREWTLLPIVVVSARAHERDKVQALDFGADDYITKPGDLEIDYDKHQVLVNGVNANLTQNEYKIIGLLGKCAGKVLTYDYIIKELWGPGTKGNNQSLRVHMANIRRKIEKNPAEPQYIFTEIGVGYRMVEGD